MATATYRPDRRDAATIVSELAATAARVPLPPELRTATAVTWGELLFPGGGLRDAAEPSQSLLLAVARLHAGLVAHFDELPARARDWYFQQRLGIRRLPPVPDRVVLVVDGDPRRLPAALPRGSLVKGGKGPRGERLYETTDALTVLGAQVLGAHGERVLRDEAGAPSGDVAVRRTGEPAFAPEAPYAPFGDAASPAAPHWLYVADDDLLMARGGVAKLTFVNPRFGTAPLVTSDLREFLEALRWEVSTPGGYVQVYGSAASTGGGMRMDLTVPGPTGPLPLAGEERVHLRCGFPEEPVEGFSLPLALAFRFDRVNLRVWVTDLPPEAAYANEGVLDLTKEFEPFGPAPRRNDAFYIKSDEAFGKRLTFLHVELAGEGVGAAVYDSPFGASGADRVRWERRAADGWGSAGATTTLANTTISVSSSSAASLESEVGGTRGRFVRARLDRGDFGWAQYEGKLLRTAGLLAKVAAGIALTNDEKALIGPQTPPEAPSLTSVKLDYITVARASTDAGGPRLFAQNGLETPVDVTAQPLLAPFSLPEVDGTFTVGLAGVPSGELVSVYFDLTEASGCDPPGPEATFDWEYLGPAATWRPLEAVDGTAGLRQSGILRFAAPLDWAEGAPSVDEAEGRWLRARASEPTVAGIVRAVRTDAVEARYRFPPGAELVDETPATRLEAGQAAKLKLAVPGVKAVVNPQPSFGGRGPEPTARFFERSAGVLRHRNRAVNPWDVEQLVLHGFPEVALCRCLPHHSRDSECAAGWAAVVVVPRSADRLPSPTVGLGLAIEAYLRERASPHLRVAVLCPRYVEVSVSATVYLRPGLPAGAAARDVERHLRAFLHPLGLAPPATETDAAALAGLVAPPPPPRAAELGRPLYRSAVIRALEEHPAVDFVEEVRFGGDAAPLERIDVDACRGLVASAPVHALRPQASL